MLPRSFQSVKRRAPYLLFAVLAVFLFWRAQYGYSFNDEPFCVTLAQRLYLGDALFRDEWHVCQNFGVVLLPFYAAFHAITGSTTGILLTFRFLYCFFWLLCMIALFRTMYPIQPLCAYLAVIYLGLFSPLDYMTLSYTSVSLMCAIGLLLVLTHYPFSEMRFRHGLLCGVLIAILCLCNPYMAIPCVLLWLCAVVARCAFRRGPTSYFLVGSLITVLLIFCCYLLLLFSRTDLSEIIRNVPEMLNDPQHPTHSLAFLLQEPFMILRALSPRLCKMVLLAVIAAVLCRILPHTSLTTLLRLGVWLASVACFCQLLFFEYQYTSMAKSSFNAQMKDIPLLGLIAFLLLRNKPRKHFAIFYGLGAVYAFCAFSASNTGSMALYMGLSVCGIAGLLFIVQLTQEFCQESSQAIFRIVPLLALSCVILFQFGTELYVRLTRTYWDAPLTELNVRLDDGPAKGLITSETNAGWYTQDVQMLQDLFEGEDTKGKTFLTYTSSPWYYLFVDLPYDTYSAWTFGSESNFPERLETYYEINNRSYPDYIYIRDPEADLADHIPAMYMVKKTTFGNAVLLCKKDQ